MAGPFGIRRRKTESRRKSQWPPAGLAHHALVKPSAMVQLGEQERIDALEDGRKQFAGITQFPWQPLRRASIWTVLTAPPDAIVG